MANDKSAANKITTRAFKTLREQFPEEYEAAKVQAAKDLGVEYKRRKTKEEKARDDVAALLRENPAVRAELFDEIRKTLTEPAVAGEVGLPQ